ncbi:MAG: flagellar basal body rod protein FlgC [Deltaproteobacteria bacterium]|nr:flagellar basal body rod protein FlgC [Deltaproteobacteria bacterium]
MNIFRSMGISSGGLQVQRRVMDAISLNLANVQTTRGSGGEPYRRKRVVFSNGPVDLHFSEMLSGRLRMAGHLYRTHPDHFGRMEIGGRGLPAEEATIQAATLDDLRPFQMVYDPSHPDADKDGYVFLPNINIVEEMVDMMRAVRSYEANITAFNAAKNMALRALEIGR